jgi:N-methylhydantoinase B
MNAPSQSSANRGLDAADRSFFANLFTSIAEEMGVTLRRTAYSPNIKERRDYSCALFDAKGQMIAQAAHIPVHLGAMPMSVEAALRACAPLAPGDVVMLNDPFAGGTHLPDITMVTGMHDAQGELLALLATRAHHADVGGMTPGSLAPTTDIYQEGLRIPPVKIRRGGELQADLMTLLLANVRTPAEREGDLRAQWAAHDVGTRRLEEVRARYGDAELIRQIDGLLQYGRTVMRNVLRMLPDGKYSFEDTLESPAPGADPIAIRVQLTLSGSSAVVDFTGSAPAGPTSLNAVEAITRSAVYYAFLCLVATPSHHDPAPLDEPPQNAGCFEPLRIVAPPGTVVNATPPHAVAGGNVETSQRIVDVVFGALAKAAPDRVPAASQGTMNNVTLGGLDPRRQAPYTYYETIAGGMGARPNAPGLDAVQTHMTNTLNTPIEALEFAYPLRIERYEIRTGSGAPGRRRGGHGIERAIRVLGAAAGALLTQRRTSGPYGLHGGGAGRPGENALIRHGRVKRLPGSCVLDLQPGDIIRIRTPGGGGYGAKRS